MTFCWGGSSVFGSPSKRAAPGGVRRGFCSPPSRSERPPSGGNACRLPGPMIYVWEARQQWGTILAGSWLETSRGGPRKRSLPTRVASVKSALFLMIPPRPRVKSDRPLVFSNASLSPPPHEPKPDRALMPFFRQWMLNENRRAQRRFEMAAGSQPSGLESSAGLNLIGLR